MWKEYVSGSDLLREIIPVVQSKDEVFENLDFGSVFSPLFDGRVGVVSRHHVTIRLCPHLVSVLCVHAVFISQVECPEEVLKEHLGVRDIWQTSDESRGSGSRREPDVNLYHS